MPWVVAKFHSHRDDCPTLTAIPSSWITTVSGKSYALYPPSDISSSELKRLVYKGEDPGDNWDMLHLKYVSPCFDSIVEALDFECKAVDSNGADLEVIEKVNIMGKRKRKEKETRFLNERASSEDEDIGEIMDPLSTTVSQPEYVPVMETHIKTEVMPEERKHPVICQEWWGNPYSGKDEEEHAMRNPVKKVKSKKFFRNLGKEKVTIDLSKQINNPQESMEEENLSPQNMTRDQLLRENAYLKKEVERCKKQRDEAYESMDLLRRLEAIVQSQRVREPEYSTSSYGDVKEEWTSSPIHPHLRHPRNGENVPLVSGKDVYMRKNQHMMMSRSTASPTALARKLLEEVFTMEALLTCSVKGHSSNGLGKAERREPLYANGIAAILAFVHQNDDANGRPWSKNSELVAAMGRRLNELRRINGLAGVTTAAWIPELPEY